MFGHFIHLWGRLQSSRALVVLFIVYAASASIPEFEGDAPRPVDVNRVANWLSAQRVEVETKQIHFVGVDCSVQLIEPSQDSFLHLFVDFRRFSVRPQVAERLVFEGPDHNRAR
jgi:hypothetical protein